MVTRPRLQLDAMADGGWSQGFAATPRVARAGRSDDAACRCCGARRLPCVVVRFCQPQAGNRRRSVGAPARYRLLAENVRIDSEDNAIGQKRKMRKRNAVNCSMDGQFFTLIHKAEVEKVSRLIE